MTLDLRKFLPSGIVSIDSENDLKLFLEIFSEVYDDLKGESEKVLESLDLGRCAGFYLPYIGRYLGAETIRLNMFENSAMDIDSNGDGLADDWTSTCTADSIVSRRISLAQRLEGTTNQIFYQALTMDSSKAYVMYAKLRVVSGSLRLGDVADNSDTLLVNSADNKGVWTEYQVMFIPNNGSRNLGLKLMESGTVVEVDDIYLARHDKEILVRVWLRNASIEYRRKGCKTGLASVISLLTGTTINSWVEQKLPNYPLIYNTVGNDYIYFGEDGAPDPASGNPPSPFNLYSTEWESLNTVNDMVSRYFDFGVIRNGAFEDSPTQFTAYAGTLTWGNEKVRWGSKSLTVTGDPISFYQDSVTVEEGKRYVFSAWVYIPSSANFTQLPRLIVRPSGGGSAIVTGSQASAYKDGRWQEIKVVLPNTNSVPSLRIEMDANGSSSVKFHTDGWWGSQRKWVKITLNTPGASLEAEVEDLLNGVLPNYLPMGVEFDIEFV